MMASSAGALAAARNGGTKVQPVENGEISDKLNRSKPRKKRRKTVLKGMKDADESVPPTDTIKAKFRICCESPMSSSGAMIFHTLFGMVILLSLVFMTGETLNHNGIIFPNNLKPHQYKMMEYIFTVLFTIDLVFRALIADRYFIKRRYPDHIEAHLPFFRDLLNWFDFLSILPLPIDILVGTLFRGLPVPKYVRILSVFRVLRIFKVTRHFEGTRIILKTAQSSAAPILVSCFMLLSFMFVVSPVLFFVEPCFNQEDCIFHDAFNSMYYLMITLTTVGYGDQIPATPAGKAVGVLMMLSGALYMAMPLAIIGTKFDQAYQQHEQDKLLKNKKWAENQMRRLQNVTRSARRKRALHLGYQIAAEVGDLIDLDETWEKKNGDKEFEDSKTTLEQTRHELLSEIFEDSGSLALDLNVLFGLNYHEIMAESLSVRKKTTDDGVSLGGAFWASNDPFSKKKDALSEEEMRAVELIEKGKKEIAEMHNTNSEYLQIVEDAIESDTCRDKIWLCTEVPKSSKCAFVYHSFSLGMTLLSILLFLAETTTDFNDYREGGRVCKQIVKYHCSAIYNKYKYEEDDTETIKLVKDEAFINNLGCWSTDFMIKHLNHIQNLTIKPKYTMQTYEDYYNLGKKNVNLTIIEEEYGGCFEEGGFQTAELDAKCKWPAPHLGFTCDAALRWNYVYDGSTKKQVRPHADYTNPDYKDNIYHTTWKDPFNRDWSKRENDYASRGVDLDDKWKPALTNSYGSSTDEEITICERKQCISNDGADWAPEFFIGEIVFASWFFLELILRLFSARSYKKYFSECSNIFDVFAVFISVGEAMYLPVLLGGPLYEVWGNPTGDPAIMRAFRLLVTIRFISMQRHFSGLKVIKMTVKKVAGKMKIPIFFFFVFAVVFASFFYIIESGDLFIDCKEGDYKPDSMLSVVNKCAEKTGSRPECIDIYNKNWGVCRSCPEPSEQSDWKTDYNNEFKYNGTCSNFVLYDGENGKRLTAPKIEDMLDAIWTMIVTMTTVGYGGFFPIQPFGKIVALMAALFGSFYMAMPLTIVGSKFYEIYEDVEDEDEVLEAELTKIFKKKEKETETEKEIVKSEVNLSITALSKLKMKSLSAKDRVREMGLHKDEIEMAFDYITAVDQLPNDHSKPILEDFALKHFSMMKLMSKHLVHRKTAFTS